jgi:cytosine permease
LGENVTASTAVDDYANRPLPEHLTVAGWRVGLIVASFAIALPGFLNGAQTGLALGFTEAVLAAFLAGLLLCLAGCFTSIISVRTRLTTYLLVQRSFGRHGAALVNVAIAIVHFCWFGVNISFFGDAMVAAAGEGYGIPGGFDTFVIIGSVLMTVSTIFGFRTLDRLALIAVPLLGITLVAVCVVAVRQHGIVLQPPATPPVPMSFGIALSALIGGNMLAVATMPDLSRYVRSTRDAVTSMALSFPIAGPLLMVASALTALATLETDIMKLIVGLGFGAPALFLLVLSIWTLNASNLYSAGLSLNATFPSLRQWVCVLAGGAIGTVFALMGIINAFIPFLLFLGLIIPPIAAIYVIDGFTTFRHADPGTSIQDLPGFRWHAVGTWLGSIAVAVLAAYEGVTLTTVPALDATIGAAIAYLIILRVRERRRRPEISLS